MATHDYVLANASGASFRADLNNALAAIVTNNSNATAPATTYAYQWWADTTANQLKLRNSANDDWIVIQELDGTMLMEDGTVAAPGLSFASDTDTGFFRPAANRLGIATSGVERVEFGTTEVVFNDGADDVNFRVEGDAEANLFFVDAGTNRVGINTNSPTEILTIDGNIEFESSTQAIKFAAGNSATNSIECNSGSGPRASIDFLGVGSSQTTDIVFKTAETSSTSAERMRIKTTTGNVGIGTDSPDEKLHIAANNSAIGSNWTNAGNLIRVEDLDNSQGSGQITGGIVFEGNDSDAAGVQAGIFAQAASATGGGDIAFHTAASGTTLDGTEDPRMVIHNDGNVGIGTTSPAVELDVNGEVRASTGILFGTDTAAANTLDDYEEGSWTPTFYGGTTAGSYTFTFASWYTKIGNMVTAYGLLSNITDTTLGSGQLTIGGLPFVGTNKNSLGSVILDKFDLDSATMNVTANLVSNTSTLQIRETRDNTTDTTIDVTARTQDGSDIFVQICYQVA